MGSKAPSRGIPLLERWYPLRLILITIPLLLITGCSEEYFEINREINGRFVRESDTLTDPAPPDTTTVDPLTLMKRSLHDDLAVVLSDEELAEMESLADSVAVESWLTAYWLRQDPTPTSPVNERRDEHHRRLEHARATYPLPEAPGYDIRGRDYILFGPPDQISERDPIIGGFYHPRRETWYWHETDMLAEYWDFANTGRFTPAGVDAWSRNMIREGNVTDVSGFSPADRQSDDRPGKLKSKGIYQEAVREKRVLYQHVFEEDELWSVFAVDCFQGRGDSTQVYLSYQVAMAQLEFRPVGDRFQATLNQSLALRDGEGRIVARHENEITLRRGSPLEHAGELFTGLMSEQIPAGDYRLNLRLKDPRAGRGEMFTSEIRVPLFPVDSLTVSDLCFGSALEPTAGDPDHESAATNRLNRGGSGITPHPLRSYSSEQPIRVYFEVYGLATDLQGLSDYRLRYSIRKQGRRWRLSRFWRRSRGGDLISSTFTQQDRGGRASFPLTISAAEFEPGTYILVVEVTDRLSGAEASRESGFNITPLTP